MDGLEGAGLVGLTGIGLTGLVVLERNILFVFVGLIPPKLIKLLSPSGNKEFLLFILVYSFSFGLVGIESFLSSALG